MKRISCLLMLGAVLALSACGLTKKDLGLAAQGPDETKVITKQPLILPPEFDVRPQVVTEDNLAENE